MFKKLLALPVMLIALLAFTLPATAKAGIKTTGEQCDKAHKKYCDKEDHKDCDKGEWKKGEGHHGYGHNKHGKRGFNILMMADKIGLSEDQIAKIKAIKSSHEKATIMIDAEIDVLKVELKDMGHDYSTDIKVYAKKVREIKSKEGDKKIAKFKFRKDISALMTPEQREKIKDYYMKKHKK